MNFQFRKIVIAILCLFLGAGRLYSQNTGNIHGSVSSTEGHLQYANVLVFNNVDSLKPIQAVITDSTGKFSFSNLTEGRFILKIFLIGYETEKRMLEINNVQKNVDAGNIVLKMMPKALQTIQVSGQKKLIEKTSEGFVVNAAANLTQVGGTLTDLLRNTPTIVVDADGAITVRGKTPLILINGRNSSFTNTDQIASSSIESIEIINNPSAKYDAAAESGIINIKLKKNKQNGFNGAVVLGAGYGARGRLNSSILVNNKTSKWNVGLGYDNRFGGRIRSINGDRINFNLPEAYSLVQRRSDTRTDGLHNTRLNIDYSPNKKHSFGFEALRNYEDENNKEFLTSTISTKSNQFNSTSTRKSIEIQKEKLTEFALNHSKKFDDKRKSWVSSINSSFGDEKQQTGITSQALNEKGAFLGNEFLQQTKNYEISNVTNLKTDYVQPISAKAELQTGYKSTIRHLDADFKSLDYINGTFVSNGLSSNRFDFKEQIHAGYLQFSTVTGNRENPLLKYDVGLRAEKVWNSGKVLSNTATFNKNYLNFFPSVGLAYFKNQDEFWKLTYSKRISRPSLGQLNPFVDITDSLNPRGGNPDLKPELIQSYELGYSKDWSAFSVYAVLFYRHSNNAIRSFTLFNPNGVALTIPLNFGNVSTYGVENVATVKAASVYDLNISFSLFQQNYEGQDLAKDVVNNVFSWNGKWINNLTPWKGGKFQITGVYNSPSATTQGTVNAIYYADMGFQQKLGKGNARLGLVFSDVFNTQKYGYQRLTKDFSFTRISKTDTRAVLLTFAYTFGTSFKEKLMENKFSND
jgi:outer membrane receptor protein involved in Fe transport